MIDLSVYLDLTKMMVLATKDEEGNPYTSNMYFRVDEDYNFYFKSKTFREHSKHIEKNLKVAWSIVNTELYTAQSKDKKGLQFQGIAEMLTGIDLEKAEKELYGKEKSAFEIMQSGHMIYKCSPTRVKIYDETLESGPLKIIEF